MIFVLFFPNSALTAVSADKLTPAAESVDGQAAVIRASLAVCHGGGKLQGIDLIDRKHRGDGVFLIAFPCDQGGAERAHDAGNIRPYRLTVRDFLKASQHGVVVESTALYNDVFAEF